MTITEHLEFSVLTAPLAAVDRRSLSEAWYSALYAQSSRPKAVTPLRVVRPSTGRTTHAERPAQTMRRSPSTTGLLQGKPASTASLRSSAVDERRALRLPLARKIERAFFRPHKPVQKATFVLEGERGRVQILLQQRGARVQLVAICPSKAQAHVMEALAQARYALAARGIALDARTHGMPC